VSPVNGDHSTTLTSLLGFEHDIGLQFLVGTGLIKRLGGDKPCYTIVQNEWEKFILKENLQDVIESVNWMSVMRSKYYFINYGRKARLHHRPIDQFSSKHPLKAKPLFIIECQQKFHRQLSNALVATCHYNPTAKEEKEEDSICSESEEVILEEEPTQPTTTFVQDSFIINATETPHLAELLGAQKVSKSFLNNLFLEIFKVVKSNPNTMDFEYKNGKRGRAIIVPKVKNYDSF